MNERKWERERGRWVRKISEKEGERERKWGEGNICGSGRGKENGKVRKLERGREEGGRGRVCEKEMGEEE